MRKIVPLLTMFWLVLVEAHAQAPQFHTYLATVDITEGLSEDLSAPAYGTEPISYQWQKDGTDIPGATTDTYRIENAVLADEGEYTLIATNADGSATATIQVDINENSPPSQVAITMPGPATTFTPGTEFYFEGYGHDPDEDWTLTSTWTIDYHDNGNVTPISIAYIESPGDGETAGYFHINPDLTPSAGAFIRIRLTVRDQLNESLTTYIDVPWSGQLNSTPPEIEEHPEDASVAAGSTVIFSVNARFATSYQWTFEGTNIPGATSATYQITNAQSGNAGTYQVLVSNGAGTTPSEEAELTVTGSSGVPVITDQPDDATIAEGLSVSFEVSATGATSYQWQFEGTNIPGATSASYHIADVSETDEGTYTVLVSNSAGTTQSDDAELTVTANSAPTAVISGVQPSAGYQPGHAVYFEGSGADPDQQTPVELTWNVELRRGGLGYAGPAIAEVSPDGESGYFMVPAEQDLQPGDVFRLHLTAEDEQGLTGTSYVDVYRDTLGYIVIKTNPANLSVLVDGQTVSARYRIDGEVGDEVTVGPVNGQTFNGKTYAFSNWAHGGAPVQTFTLPAHEYYYTMNYSSPLTGPWRTTEVGAVNIAGSATYNNGTYTLTASGNDIWNGIDGFRFVYQSIHGDVDIRARVATVTNTHPWTKAGVMIRNSTDPKAKNVMMLISAGSGASFQRRVEAGGATVATVTGGAAPSWIRVVRSGSTFTSYISSDGSNWSQVGTTTVTMNERIYVGLALTSHSSNNLATATFADVSVSTLLASKAVANVRQEESFDVYPNPAEGNTLQVNVKGKTAKHLQIVNVFGRVVFERKVVDGSQIEVDIEGLPRGLYVVRVSDSNKVQTRSVIRK